MNALCIFKSESSIAQPLCHFASLSHRFVAMSVDPAKSSMPTVSLLEGVVSFVQMHLYLLLI